MGPFTYKKPGKWHRRLAPKQHLPFSVLDLS